MFVLFIIFCFVLGVLMAKSSMGGVSSVGDDCGFVNDDMVNGETDVTSMFYDAAHHYDHAHLED